MTIEWVGGILLVGLVLTKGLFMKRLFVLVLFLSSFCFSETVIAKQYHECMGIDDSVVRRQCITTTMEGIPFQFEQKHWLLPSEQTPSKTTNHTTQYDLNRIANATEKMSMVMILSFTVSVIFLGISFVI